MSGSVHARLSQSTDAVRQAGADQDSPDDLAPSYGVSFTVVLALFAWLLLVLYLRAA